MGKNTSNIPYQQPSMGTINVPPLVPLQGGSNCQTSWPQPGGTYTPSGNPNPSNILLSGGFNPSQQGRYAMPYGNQFQMGGYVQYPYLMALNPYRGMYPYATNQYPGMPYGGSGLNVNQKKKNQSTQNPFSPSKLPFSATLELPNLSKLTNHPIRHHFAWPPFPVKIPTDIPKFDGKTREDPANNITTYHM